jgi:polyhydroxybutyrate depolymerase
MDTRTGGLHRLRIRHGGLERRCLVREPEHPVLPQGWPLVFMLHGAGATALWTLNESRWQAIADREGILLAFPEGVPRDPGQTGHFLRNPLLWNETARTDLPDDVGYLAALLGDELPSRFPVDRRRVFGSGFSNGAGMVFRLAASNADWLTAVAPVSGLCPVEEIRLTRPVPTLLVLGGRDPLVPWHGGDVKTPWGSCARRPAVADTLHRWAKALGCRDEPVRIDQGNGLVELAYSPEGADEPLFVVLRDDALGHHWPGGRAQLPRRLAGPPSARLDAAETLWRFFARARPLDA